MQLKYFCILITYISVITTRIYITQEISYFGKHILCVWASEFNDGSLRSSCLSNECLSTFCKYLCECRYFVQELVHIKMVSIAAHKKDEICHSFKESSKPCIYIHIT